MKRLIVALLLFAVSFSVRAQTLQDSLSFYADVLLNAENPAHRHYANQLFESEVKSSMVSDTAFQKSFDLMGIPLLYNADSAFRILSWQVQLEENTVTKAFFQYRGEEELIEFQDKFAYVGAQEYGSLPVNRWIGAVYTSIYEIPMLDSIYLLKGFNHIDPYSTLQILEILDLRSGKIQLGVPLFENDKNEIVHRRIFEVAKGANFNLVIADSLNRIVSDHLIAVPYHRDESRMVNVPDGSYEVLEWNGDRWIYKDRLFENRFQELPLDSMPKNRESKDIFGRPKRQ